jgi:hypothetical protein
MAVSDMPERRGVLQQTLRSREPGSQRAAMAKN